MATEIQLEFLGDRILRVIALTRYMELAIRGDYLGNHPDMSHWHGIAELVTELVTEVVTGVVT